MKTVKTVDQIRKAIADLEGELTVLHSNTWVVQTPSGGYLCRATSSDIIHLPTESEAQLLASSKAAEMQAANPGHEEYYSRYRPTPYDAGLEIWNGRDGDIRDCPEGGATVTLNYCSPIDGNWERWYPSTEAAKAKLLEIARRDGRIPDANGLRVDLTAPGCHTSNAYVTRRESAPSLSDTLGWGRTFSLGDGRVLVQRRDKLSQFDREEQYAILRRHAEGDVIAPDHRSFRLHGFCDLYSLATLTGKPLPWNLEPFPSDKALMS